MTGSLLSPPRAFHILGLRVLLDGGAGEAGWMEPLAALLAPFTAPADGDGLPPVRTLRVSREAKPARWVLREEDGEPEEIEAAALAHELEWRIFSAVVCRAPYPLLLHAGAVARAGRALVLPGVSGAGKSTLTLALATRGWQPLTDDLCPLDERDGVLEALPCPRCCHLSLTSYLTLVEAGVALERPIAELDSYARPARWAARAPVATILLPTYQAGAPLTVTPLSQAESLAGLISATFTHERVPRGRQIAVAKRLSCQASAYRVVYSDLAGALAAIETLAARWEAPAPPPAEAPAPEPVGAMRRGAD